MGDGPIQFFESDLGNRFLIRDGLQIENVRRTAQTVIDTEGSRNPYHRLRHLVASHALDRSVIVTMGDYEDDEVSFAPAQGVAMAELLLERTAEIVETLEA